MKKIFSIAMVATFAAVLVFSCKKKDDNPTGSWTCTCTYTVGGMTNTVDLPITNATKSQAQSGCDAQRTNLNNANAGISATCNLK